MKRFLLVGFAVSSLFAWTGCSDSASDRRESDVGCEIGSTKQEDCNTCQCTKMRGWVCTERVCGDVGAAIDVQRGSTDGGNGVEDVAPRDSTDPTDDGSGRDGESVDGEERDTRDDGTLDTMSPGDAADTTPPGDAADTVPVEDVAEDATDTTSPGDATDTTARDGVHDVDAGRDVREDGTDSRSPDTSRGDARSDSSSGDTP